MAAHMCNLSSCIVEEKHLEFKINYGYIVTQEPPWASPENLKKQQNSPKFSVHLSRYLIIMNFQGVLQMWDLLPDHFHNDF